jgi:hypothetical protein
MQKFNWIQNWLCAWVKLLEGLFQVVTLGLIYTNWGYWINLKISYYKSKGGFNETKER